MRYAFWQEPRHLVDAAIGTFIEYGTTNRDKNKESYAEMWQIAGSSRGLLSHPRMPPLEKYGIKIHYDDVHAGVEAPHRGQVLRAQRGAVLRGRLAGELSGASKPRPTRTSSGSSTSIRAGTRSSAKFWARYEKRRTAPPDQRAVRTARPAGRLPSHRCWSCLVPVPRSAQDMVARTRSTASCTPSPMSSTAGRGGGVRLRVPGPADAGDGARFSGRREWERSTTTGTSPSAIQDPRLRPHRRQDAGAAAAPAVRRPRDVDPRRRPRPHAGRAC